MEYNKPYYIQYHVDMLKYICLTIHLPSSFIMRGFVAQDLHQMLLPLMLIIFKHFGRFNPM